MLHEAPSWYRRYESAPKKSRRRWRTEDGRNLAGCGGRSDSVVKERLSFRQESRYSQVESVSSRHGGRSLFSISWTTFYSARVSIRPICASRSYQRRSWAAVPDVLTFGQPAANCREFCLLRHVSTLAELKGRSSAGACGLF